MEQLTTELAPLSQESRRLQKQAAKQQSRRHARREHALLVATVAFCHEPTAGETIAAAMKRKYKHVFHEDLVSCTREIEGRFLETSVDKLAQWLDWEGDLPKTNLTEAKRLVEEVRLHVWISIQNSTQGVAPPTTICLGEEMHPVD